MAENSVQRRLTAILSADVAGFSRLMEADEAATHARLIACRAAMDDLIEGHRGRIVGTAGDSVLAEFASAIEAVGCAIAIQRALKEQNAGVADDQRMAFRIGVNLGDVIIDGDDIYGDGVNLAARIQEIAEPGGVCISAKVQGEVGGKLDATFEDLGEHSVKNIAAPVRVWRWADQATAPPAGTPPALPDKPSIAVLPFDNMSGDPEQEYFADGITEDLITALSKIRWFFVIARNSTFVYKGRPVDVTEVGRALGVRYVLEGSVRRGGKRVRISAQLIEAASGRHVWAERYDRDLDDIFALQDEMTDTIVRAIEPELGIAERERAIRKPPGSLDAWNLLQRGLWHHYRFTKEDNAEAQGFFRQAIAVDAGFAQPLAAFAHARYWDALFGFAADPDAVLTEGFDHARRAVSLDDREPFAHFALGRVQTLLGELDGAITELERAIELNANFAHAYYGLGWALLLFGRPADALERIDTALRLNPHDPAIWTFLGGRAMSLFFLDRLDEAAECARRSAQSAITGLWAHAIEAAVLGHLGRDQEAAAALARAYDLKPDFSAEFLRQVMPFRNPEYAKRMLDGLANAGLEI